MEFQSQSQKECYEKVAPWIKELFGSFSMARENAPAFAVIVGSALAQIGVSAWGETDATITTRSYLVTDAELSPDLMLFLLRENDRMRFGAFGVDAENDIFFEHTILGASADMAELRSSVMAVVITADQYDDKIIERWGGTRMLERSAG
jgi:hypothetical protein